MKYYLTVGSFLVVDDNEFPPTLTDVYEHAKIYKEENKREDVASFYGGHYVDIEEHKNRTTQINGMIKRKEQDILTLKKAKEVINFKEEENEIND